MPRPRDNPYAPPRDARPDPAARTPDSPRPRRAGRTPDFFEKQSWFSNPIIAVLVPLEAVILIIVLSVVVGLGGQPVPPWVFPIIVLASAAPLVILSQAPLRTIVQGQDLFVGYVVPHRRRVDLTRVTHCEAIAYSPLTDCGGWGLKASRKFGTVLNVSGERGVRLVYSDADDKERRMLIGSRRAEELAAAINRARAAAPIAGE